MPRAPFVFFFGTALLLVSGCAGYAGGMKHSPHTAQGVPGPAGPLYVDEG